MTGLVLDAGALIALDRRDRSVQAALAVAHADRRPIRTTAAVVAQVWRDAATQPVLARVLRAVDVLPLDVAAARGAGVLLGRAGSSDVVNAALVGVVRRATGC